MRIFGKVWRKRAGIWKSLEKLRAVPLEARHSNLAEQAAQLGVSVDLAPATILGLR
jgi:hypothetical protein